MESNHRIIFNSVVLYMKIVICMAISLFTVPLVLHALGDKDYGLFNLIAGVIAMLAFINSAMTVSTQRYLSVTIGERDKTKLLQVYNLSILLHILIGIVIVLLIEISIPLLMNYALNIGDDQKEVAYLLFQFLSVSIFFTVITVPFDAVLNSYENMLFFSITGIIEAVLRLILALSLTMFTAGRLEIYGLFTAVISLVILLIKYFYCHYKYKDLYIHFPSLRNKKLFVEIASFAGWNTLSSFALIGRNQGVALILNSFFGTIINASYGIANQVNGVLNYFSATIQKSINPQLMESEGLHEHQRLTNLTFALTKYSVFILCAISIPLIIELPYIFKIWIGKIPPYTIAFTRLVIVLSIITQASSGFMSAVQSSGKIKAYTITICISTLSGLVFAYYVLKRGGAPDTALMAICIVEVFVLSLRAYFAWHLQRIPLFAYFKNAIAPNLLLVVITGLALYGSTRLFQPSFSRLCLACLLDAILYCVLGYLFVLDDNEKQFFKRFLLKIRNLITK